MTKQAPHFYNFPITEVTININDVMCFGYFDTYLDKEKIHKVSQPMVKFSLAAIGGHPYNIRVTDEEMNDFIEYISDLKGNDIFAKIFDILGTIEKYLKKLLNL